VHDLKILQLAKTNTGPEIKILVDYLEIACCLFVGCSYQIVLPILAGRETGRETERWRAPHGFKINRDKTRRKEKPPVLYFGRISLPPRMLLLLKLHGMLALLAARLVD
jgi:hypothetical protein